MELDGRFIAVPTGGLDDGFNGSLRLNEAAAKYQQAMQNVFAAYNKSNESQEA
jgi:hypothetical protein